MSALDARSVRSRLTAAVRRSNPGANVSVRIVKLNPICDERFGTGQFRTASLEVTAPGYRPTRMLGTVDSAGGVMVR